MKYVMMLYLLSGVPIDGDSFVFEPAEMKDLATFTGYESEEECVEDAGKKMEDLVRNLESTSFVVVICMEEPEEMK